MVISGEMEEARLKTIVLVAAILEIDQIFNPSAAAAAAARRPSGGLCLLRYEITGPRRRSLFDIVFRFCFPSARWARLVRVEWLAITFPPSLCAEFVSV